MNEKNKSTNLLAAAMLFVALLLVGCDRQPSAPNTSDAAPVKAPVEARSRLSVKRSVSPTKPAMVPTTAQVRFVDVHEQLGIDFVYENGARGEQLMVESIGGGAGWMDFDRDGNWDLLLVQGGNATGPREQNPPNQLWRNLGEAGFIQVQLQSGVDDRGYGNGVAIADYDNDGFDDVYVTNVGSNALYHNQGDGTFVEVTMIAGVDVPQWSSSAAWGDLNGDGVLDLFVCNYLIYDPKNPLPCPHKDGTPGTCDPKDLDAEQNVCFENLGDGTFRDATSAWNLRGREEDSKSLGTAIVDLTDDGFADVVVANDTTSNFLFINDGHGMFEERGVELGCAMSGEGTYQASMGIAVGDFDRNHFFDLYMTHFTEDSNTLYANLGKSGFDDRTRLVGLHQPTLSVLGFGTVMADFDRNGSEDLFVTNGHVDNFLAAKGGYAMPPQLFSYSGSRWDDVSSEAGTFFATPVVGRAVASCDFDNDGDLDLAVVHQGSPAALLRNDSPDRDWLKVRLVGVKNNRSAIGATVRLRSGALDLVKQIVGGSSYCSSHEPMLLFGLDQATGPCSLEIRWPDGFVQQVGGVEINRSVTLWEAGRK